MSISDFPQKIKSFLGSEKGRDVYMVCLVIVVGFGAFGLGRLSVNSNKALTGVQILYPRVDGVNTESINTPSNQNTTNSKISPTTSINQQNNPDNSDKQIVASSRGSKYYYIWCSGAKNLSESNKIYFSTESEAEDAGYSKSTSCK